MISPFLLALREGLEAALILSVVLATLVRMGRRDLTSVVWLGAFLGIGLLVGAMVLISLGDAIRGELLIICSLLGLAAAIAIFLDTSP